MTQPPIVGDQLQPATVPQLITDPVTGELVFPDEYAPRSVKADAESIAVARQVITDKAAQVVAAADEAVEARDQAVAAADQATAPAAAMVAAAVAAEDIPAKVVAAVAAAPTAAHAAAEAVNWALGQANVPRGEIRPDDVWGVRFGDGSYFIEADEARGIYSQITHQPDSVPVGAVAFMVELPDELGMDWALLTQDNPARIIEARWRDGRTYPESGGGPEPETDLAPLIFVGDSLTANWGSAAGAGASAALATSLGRASVNIGIGGQTSPQIAARQGGVPALCTVSGGVIPASGSVSVTAWSTNLAQLTSAGSRSFVGTLAGVPGTLTGTRDSGGTYTYTFTRTTPGIAVPCPAGTPFQTGYQWRDRVPIVCVGRNNFKAGQDEPAVIVGHARSILDWSRRGADGLVLSVPPWEGESVSGEFASTRARLDALNAALLAAFPTRFIDTAAYLRSAAVLQSQGITPTATDLQNITDGITPESFRSDAGHYNAAAYAAINALLTQAFTARGPVA
ncbi:SGNH/GDSL hydrolase family protein [Nakamurella leprariae]|uniref:Uncharacterized protein n=1 Tax=Nakamurella leprariae TaxID=2803911 RepID=A0A938YCV7_9ACTN|nr:hypothetical protein [Nakamurella leprariae]MBM9467278.1 hypothetical protein [Nakamurella leprariae]